MVGSPPREESTKNNACRVNNLHEADKQNLPRRHGGTEKPEPKKEPRIYANQHEVMTFQRSTLLASIRAHSRLCRLFLVFSVSPCLRGRCFLPSCPRLFTIFDDDVDGKERLHVIQDRYHLLHALLLVHRRSRPKKTGQYESQCATCGSTERGWPEPGGCQCSPRRFEAHANPCAADGKQPGLCRHDTIPAEASVPT